MEEKFFDIRFKTLVSLLWHQEKATFHRYLYRVVCLVNILGASAVFYQINTQRLDPRLSLYGGLFYALLNALSVVIDFSGYSTHHSWLAKKYTKLNNDIIKAKQTEGNLKKLQEAYAENELEEEPFFASSILCDYCHDKALIALERGSKKKFGKKIWDKIRYPFRHFLFPFPF